MERGGKNSGRQFRALANNKSIICYEKSMKRNLTWVSIGNSETNYELRMRGTGMRFSSSLSLQEELWKFPLH